MSTPSAKIQVNLKVYEAVVTALRAGLVPQEVMEKIELANGTTDGSACDKVYCSSASGVAASTNTDYDLAGSLTDIDNNTITFAEVCLLFVRNKRTTALAYLLVGPAAANGFGAISGSKGFWNAALGAGGGNLIGPAGTAGPENSGGSFLLLYDYVGVPVVAGTGDQLRITTSAVVGATNEWDIMIIGRSA